MATPRNELAEIIRAEIAEKKERMAEIERLWSEKPQIQGQINALETTLGILLGNKPNTGSPTIVPEVTSFSQLGLSEAIRFVLKHAPPSGLRPIEVTKELASRGFSVGSGRVPLDARVAAEISRLRRAGHAAKRDGKYFAVGG